MSVAAAAKAALVGTDNVLAALPALAGVTVSYGLPRDVPREVVYGGALAGSVTLAAMRGSGRIKREENLSLQLHIRVRMPGQATAEAGDVRAVEIADAIAEYIAANPTLGGVADLLLASVEQVDMESGAVDDDGVTSLLTLQVALKSYLT